MLPAIEGWRKIEARFPADCECGRYIEPRMQCFYSPTMKKVRCISCQVEADHAERSKTDNFEVWLAEVADEEADTTATGNIVITNYTKWHGLPYCVKLIQHIATYHRSETTMKVLREQYQAIRIPE